MHQAVGGQCSADGFAFLCLTVWFVLNWRLSAPLPVVRGGWTLCSVRGTLAHIKINGRAAQLSVRPGTQTYGSIYGIDLRHGTMDPFNDNSTHPWIRHTHSQTNGHHAMLQPACYRCSSVEGLWHPYNIDSFTCIINSSFIGCINRTREAACVCWFHQINMAFYRCSPGFQIWKIYPSALWVDYTYSMKYNIKPTPPRCNISQETAWRASLHNIMADVL